MQMILPLLLRILDTFLQYLLGLLHILSMQINRIIRDPVRRIILSENIITGLLVVIICFRAMLLSFFGKLVGEGTVAALIGLVGAVEAGTALAGFFVREVAESVVFLLGGRVDAVVECWKRGRGLVLGAEGRRGGRNRWEWGMKGIGVPLPPRRWVAG